MTTSVSESRLEQRFKLWDADSDGRIERSDFQAEAERIIKAFGETADSLRGRGVMDAYLNMYDFLAAKAGVGHEGLSFQQFSGVVNREMIGQGNAGFARVLRPTIRAIVDLCDVTGDGAVNPAEFKRWIEAIGAR
ncbi:MAG TPA: EF-hand domain-containing protein, partial [Pseudonocardiaceae bacterium]|nr:EF-hand domain-containing protein [Pseudonocardiaceae bacterium]